MVAEQWDQDVQERADELLTRFGREGAIAYAKQELSEVHESQKAESFWREVIGLLEDSHVFTLQQVKFELGPERHLVTCTRFPKTQEWEIVGEITPIDDRTRRKARGILQAIITAALRGLVT